MHERRRYESLNILENILISRVRDDNMNYIIIAEYSAVHSNVVIYF
jgi:hypothetical protein